MRPNNRGFTMIEALVVVVLLAAMTALAVPQFNDWRRKAQFREAAREIASTLREARSKAIAANLEHQVAIDVSEASLAVTGGDRPYNSSAWPTTFPAVNLAGTVSLKSGAACNQNTDVNIVFFPNGTSDVAPTVCVVSSEGAVFFRIVVTSTTSGRVVVE